MEKADDFYAHTPPPDDSKRWHKLVDHLESVAMMAAEFAEPFGATELARWIGWLHDMGKFNPDFQQYLRDSDATKRAGRKLGRKGPPHAIYGAVFALRSHLAAAVIASHHSGLPDHKDLRERFKTGAPGKEAGREIGSVLNIAAAHLPSLPSNAEIPPDLMRGVPDLLPRMLLSCLVDADRLDTEAHFDPTMAAKRQRGKPDWAELIARFDSHLKKVSSRAADTPVNRVRIDVLGACEAAATLSPGLFRLTVPTGGGKTLSSLAFALRHAAKHDLQRIIVAIPYTSTIDQTADIYRAALGEENVLEHHSALSLPDDPTEGQEEAELRRRLASENWDAPIVVTTTVQLFESLFSNQTSRVRKLHNITRSVIVLDEAQCLPPKLLPPIVSGLQELADHYGVSSVLCTATQPALDEAIHHLDGLRDVREIVPEYRRHFEVLRRVNYEIDLAPMSAEAVAAQLARHDQALVVLNTRKDALRLLDALEEARAGPLFHLSALLCPAHRRDVLAEVRRRLHPDVQESCLLVSTQVIECGVDIDAPFAMRAIAPLDRIAQTAGRVNREGRRPEGGVLRVFVLEEGSAPRGAYATGIGEAEILLREPGVNLHDPDLYTRFFRKLYHDVIPISCPVQKARKNMDFKTVADLVKFIPDETIPVVVPYHPEKVERVVESVARRGAATADEWRSLQPYTVSLYKRDFQTALNRQDAREVAPGLYLWQGAYDRLRGIGTDNPDPADLVV